jgi:16S rRNA C967 or C1407 C5-methylase (RsmB/RsmF family)
MLLLPAGAFLLVRLFGLSTEMSIGLVLVAAAPGGKSTQILQLTNDKALLIAVEKNRRRIRSLRANLQRMRFSSYILLRADALTLSFPPVFDRALLDAPSTGEGIIRRDPSRKTSRTIDDLIMVHRLQVKLLKKAVELVKPGGVIVYSACTLAPEEGEMVIDLILKLYDNLTVEPHKLSASPALKTYYNVSFDERVKHCGRFWPHIHDSEGFFVCRLRKLQG